MQVRFVLATRPGDAPGEGPVPSYTLAQVREVVTREPGVYRRAPPLSALSPKPQSPCQRRSQQPM